MTASAPRAALPDALRLGSVHLVVSDLERALAFYTGPLGLTVHGRDPDAGTARLGAGSEDLVLLREERGARPAGRHAGLFHFALLSDSREELAHAVLRLVATGTPVSGASDHGVSEAIYLDDPDGNGIELYADRPRSQWPDPAGSGGRVGMFTEPLDVEALLATAEGAEARAHAGAGLVLGHVHLHVGDIPAALAFHRDVVGFELMQDLGSAEFLSAGGYHHHLGVNVWRGQGIPAAPERGVVGLERWVVVLPAQADVAAVRGRVETGGATTGDVPGGFLTRDPAGVAVAFVAG